MEMENETTKALKRAFFKARAEEERARMEEADRYQSVNDRLILELAKAFGCDPEALFIHDDWEGGIVATQGPANPSPKWRRNWVPQGRILLAEEDEECGEIHIREVKQILGVGWRPMSHPKNGVPVEELRNC